VEKHTKSNDNTNKAFFLLCPVFCLLNSDFSFLMNKINLREKLSFVKDHWNPRIVAELNGQYLKLVKFKGPFTWHHHEAEDEMFLVVKGRFRMEFRDPGDGSPEPGQQREEWIEEGEFIVVPRGVEHRPVADEEAEVLLFEPATTLNTGNVRDNFTVSKLDWL
jgi:mannose-6-phosphate isomerase-like protein (cupin superfamily)